MKDGIVNDWRPILVKLVFLVPLSAPWDFSPLGISAFRLVIPIPSHRHLQRLLPSPHNHFPRSSHFPMADAAKALFNSTKCVETVAKGALLRSRGFLLSRVCPETRLGAALRGPVDIGDAACSMHTSVMRSDATDLARRKRTSALQTS